MGDYFYMAPRQKVWWQKMASKQSRWQREVGDVTRPIATHDQSNIYHFQKQIVEKLTTQARITHDMYHVLL
jgi:hypothetical protein